MTNKEKLIYISVAIWITIIAFIILNAGQKGEIAQLYQQKGAIVTQKSQLLQQDLDIRNKIDWLNKQILEIDAKLQKAINPQQTGLTQAWQPEQSPSQILDDYLSGQGYSIE